MSISKAERIISILAGLSTIITFCIYILGEDYKIIDFGNIDFFSILKTMMIVAFIEICIALSFGFLLCVIHEKSNTFSYLIGMIIQYCSCSLSVYIYFYVTSLPKNIFILIIFILSSNIIKLLVPNVSCEILKSCNFSWYGRRRAKDFLDDYEIVNYRFYLSFIFFITSFLLIN